MSVGTRVASLERDHFAAACCHFRPWFLAHLHHPDNDRRDRAALVAAGAPAGGSWVEIDAWLDTYEPTTPGHQAACGAIDLLMEHPDDHAAIRAALAVVAPFLDHDTHHPPLAILAALVATFSSHKT